SWMKEGFEQELGRERLKLEAYKQIQQGGFLPIDEDDGEGATLVGGPTFDDEGRSGGFGDEGPTEIYGEVGSGDGQLPGAAGHDPRGDLAETGRRQGAPPVLPPLVPSEPSIQITETPIPDRAPGTPPALPLKGPPSAPGTKGSEPPPNIVSTPGTFIG